MRKSESVLELAIKSSLWPMHSKIHHQTFWSWLIGRWDRVILPSVFGSNLNWVQAFISKKLPDRFVTVYVEHSGDSIQSPLTQTSLPSNQPNNFYQLCRKQIEGWTVLFQNIAILKGIYPFTGERKPKLHINHLNKSSNTEHFIWLHCNAEGSYPER